MWAPVAKELQVPWRAAEAKHWDLGEADMVRRAGVVSFSMPPQASTTAESSCFEIDEGEGVEEVQGSRRDVAGHRSVVCQAADAGSEGGSQNSSSTVAVGVDCKAAASSVPCNN